MIYIRLTGRTYSTIWRHAKTEKKKRKEKTKTLTLSLIQVTIVKLNPWKLAIAPEETEV